MWGRRRCGSSFSERAGKMGDGGIHADEEIEIGDERGGIGKVVPFARKVVNHR